MREEKDGYKEFWKKKAYKNRKEWENEFKTIISH